MNHVLKIIPMFYYIVLSKPLDITNKNKERTLHFLMNYHIVLSFVILRLKKKKQMTAHHRILNPLH